MRIPAQLPCRQASPFVTGKRPTRTNDHENKQSSTSQRSPYPSPNSDFVTVKGQSEIPVADEKPGFESCQHPDLAELGHIPRLSVCDVGRVVMGV